MLVGNGHSIHSSLVLPPVLSCPAAVCPAPQLLLNNKGWVEAEEARREAALTQFRVVSGLCTTECTCVASCVGHDDGMERHLPVLCRA